MRLGASQQPDLVTCASCAHYIPDPIGAGGVGSCSVDAGRFSQSRRWPLDEGAPPLYPRAERYCALSTDNPPAPVGPGRWRFGVWVSAEQLEAEAAAAVDAETIEAAHGDALADDALRDAKHYVYVQAKNEGAFLQAIAEADAEADQIEARRQLRELAEWVGIKA